MGKHDLTKEDKQKRLHTKSKKHTEQNKQFKKKKKHTVLKIFLFLIILLGIFCAYRLHKAGGNILGAILNHDKDTVKNLDRLEVLILGESTGMSDTIIVASYDPKTQQAALMSIPRDTYTGDNKASAKYYHKINSLYNYGETPEKTVAAVNKITGLDIEYYIIVDTEALIQLVEIIGGLYFDVPIDMDYDDPTQNLHIHLSAGYQKLTGEQVEQLVRFRHNNDGISYPFEYANGVEDHGRSKTQRNVIIAIAKQALQLKNVPEIPTIIDKIAQYVDTNMDLNAIKDYIPYAISMNMEDIKLGRLPGLDDTVGGIWFYFHDEEETQLLVDELFRGILPEETTENNDNSSED